MLNLFCAVIALTCVVLYVPSFFYLRAFKIAPLMSFLMAPLFSIGLFAGFGTLLDLLNITTGWMGLLIPVFTIGLIAFIVRSIAGKRNGSSLEDDRSLKRDKHDKCDKHDDNNGGRSDLARTYLLAFPPYEHTWHFRDLINIFLYIACGIGLGAVILGQNLTTLDSSMLAYDNVFHMNVIDGFLKTGVFSVFGTSLYMPPTDELINPIPGSGLGFYPAAWHIVVALVAQMTGASIPLAVNGVNFAVACIVFPLSMMALLRQLFSKLPMAVTLGCVCALAMADFPWGYLVFGPLYSNMLSLAVAPAFFALCIALFELPSNAKRTPANKTARIILVLFSIFSLGVAQPNTIFFIGILLLPLAFIKLNAYFTRRYATAGNPRKKKRTAFILVCLIIFIVWCLLFYFLVFRTGIYHESWAAFTTFPQALINLLTYSLRVSTAQIVPVILTVIGIIFSMRHRRYLWISISFALAAIMYVVAAGIDGVFRYALLGLWYNDPYRLAANLAVIAIPLIVLGLYTIYSLIVGSSGVLSSHKAQNSNETSTSTSAPVSEPRSTITSTSASNISAHHTAKVSHTSSNTNSALRRVSGVLVCCLIAAVIYLPNISLSSTSALRFPFGDIRTAIQNLYNEQLNEVYTAEEQAFLKRAQAITQDSLVINQPNDGSCYATWLSDMFLYYRDCRHYGEANETPESRAIREHLSDYATDESAQNAIKSLGAEYVLLLDAPTDNTATATNLFLYEPKDWTGLESIHEDTPGFELVLSDDDMRLYRILSE